MRIHNFEDLYAMFYLEIVSRGGEGDFLASRRCQDFWRVSQGAGVGASRAAFAFLGYCISPVQTRDRSPARSLEFRPEAPKSSFAVLFIEDSDVFAIMIIRCDVPYQQGTACQDVAPAHA